MSLIGYSRDSNPFCIDQEGSNCPCQFNPPEGGTIIILCDGGIGIRSTFVTATSCAGADNDCLTVI